MSSKEISLLLTAFFEGVLSVEDEITLFNYVMDERNKDEIIDWLQQQWLKTDHYENVPSEAIFSKIKEKIRML
jgi:hypothetical protein